MITFHTDKEISENKFLVTGGAGFIGHHLVNYLMNNNAAHVKVVDNLSTGNIKNIEQHLSKANFEFINADLIDYDICLEACKNVDFIFHQAAVGSVPRSIEDPLRTNLNNVNTQLNILWAGVQQKVKRIIYASSSSVYGDNKNKEKQEKSIGLPLSPYAVSKRVNELYSMVFSNHYDIEIIGLRYFNVFGPGQNSKGPYAAVIPLFIESLLRSSSPTIYGIGNQSRDFTYVENIVQANIKAAFTKKSQAIGEIINIGAGGNTSVNQLFEIISSKLNSEIKANYAEARKGEIKNSSASIKLAAELINYSPTVLIEEGIDKTIEYYKGKCNGNI